MCQSIVAMEAPDGRYPEDAALMERARRQLSPQHNAIVVGDPFVDDDGYYGCRVYALGRVDGEVAIIWRHWIAMGFV